MTAAAESAALTGAGDQAQSRALAWSGLQVLMHELDGQRAVILEGDLAELETSYTIYERDNVLGIVRLLPCGPGGAICQPEAARLDVFDERGYGVIEGAPNRVHTIDHVEVVPVRVHVPDAGVTRVDGHESAAGLAQSPREQQQLADTGGVCVVVTFTTAGDGIPAARALEARGIVPLESPRILLAQIERPRDDASEQHVVGLLLKFVQRGDLP